MGLELIDNGELLKYSFVEDVVFLSNDVKVIGRMVFYSQRLSAVRIPETVTLIKFQALYNCKNMKSVVIPDSVKEIEEEAFGYGFDGKMEDFCILGKKDSEAERYAKENGFVFYEVIRF